MMTDKENRQGKPDEGAFSARRDGERTSRNSSTDSNSWNKPSDNRRTQGDSSDRPRRTFNDNSGGFNRGGNSFDKPRNFGDNNDRPRRPFGDNNDRPRRSFGDNNDRPQRSFGDNNDRPQRSFGDNNDRPRRPFGEQGNSFSGNSRGGNSFDRPRRTFGEGDSDKPRRTFGEGGGNRFGGNSREGNSFGGNREGNSFDRPRRTFGEGDSDRPRRTPSEGGNRFGSGNREGNSFDRPRRTFGEAAGSDRPRRSFGESGNREGNSFDRPRRSFGEGEDRPRRSFGEGEDRPRRSFGDNNDRPRRPFGEEGGFKPRPSFSGPSIPKPDRADGRPRRPRIKRENSFDHGTPYGGRSAAPKYQESLDPNTPIRLNKFLANAGICSRREADEFIQAGVVKVNGVIVSELGVKVKPIDTILFHDEPVSIEHKIYILLNKPKDCVTTSDDPQERLTVMDLVKGACFERIYPVGRLDRNTTGVLLLTNDGDLASKLTHPKYEKRKIYQVTLDKDITANDIQTILDGVTLDDCEVRADNLSYVDPDFKSVLGIEIHSGQNRVVRRIFESLGYKVCKLDRVYFAGLTKKNLPRGKWRHLSEKEVSLLKMGAFV